MLILLLTSNMLFRYCFFSSWSCPGLQRDPFWLVVWGFEYYLGSPQWMIVVLRAALYPAPHQNPKSVALNLTQHGYLTKMGGMYWIASKCSCPDQAWICHLMGFGMAQYIKISLRIITEWEYKVVLSHWAPVGVSWMLRAGAVPFMLPRWFMSSIHSVLTVPTAPLIILYCIFWVISC